MFHPANNQRRLRFSHGLSAMAVTLVFVSYLSTVLCGIIKETEDTTAKCPNVPDIVEETVSDDTKQCLKNNKVDNETLAANYGANWTFEDNLSTDQRICRFACVRKSLVESMMEEASRGLLNNRSGPPGEKKLAKKEYQQEYNSQLVNGDRDCKKGGSDVCKYLSCWSDKVNLFNCTKRAARSATKPLGCLIYSYLMES